MAQGATWLDRRLIERNPMPLSDGGFGVEVSSALEARIEHLIEQDHAQREGGRVVFTRNMLATLQHRELDMRAKAISATSGLPFHPTSEGETIAGTYRRRLDLASGRFAMIDDGLGFQLMPWKPSIERELGRQVAGVIMPSGGVDWSLGRRRGIDR